MFCKRWLFVAFQNLKLSWQRRMKRPCFRKGSAGLEGVLMCYPDSCDSWKSMLDLFFHHYEVMALERKILLPDSAIFIFKPYNNNTCHESDNIVCDQDFSLFLQETFPTWTHTSTWKIPKVTGKFGKKTTSIRLPRECCNRRQKSPESIPFFLCPGGTGPQQQGERL